MSKKLLLLIICTSTAQWAAKILGTDESPIILSDGCWDILYYILIFIGSINKEDRKGEEL